MLAFVNARAIPFKRYAGYLKLLLKHAESMGFQSPEMDAALVPHFLSLEVENFLLCVRLKAAIKFEQLKQRWS
jgi:hypothetical protein